MDDVTHHTNFKGPRVTEKQRRAAKRAKRTGRLRDNKKEVRGRDDRLRRGCAFPMCGCRRKRLLLEVSHLVHQGMGGNPKEDRNVPELLIQVCNHRHRVGRIAVDNKTLQCRPLTAAGTNGPVSWWVYFEDLLCRVRPPRVLVDGWFEVAREISPGVFDGFNIEQWEALTLLSTMEF